MPSIAVGFMILGGSRRCLLKKGFGLRWRGIASTRVGGGKSSPESFAPITNRCMAGVFRKELKEQGWKGRRRSSLYPATPLSRYPPISYANPNHRSERSVWLRSPAHSCVARIDLDGLSDLRSDQVFMR